MAKIINIAIHNFGPIGNNQLTRSAHLTEKDINESHKGRWPDFPSEFNGSFIGYNVIIYPSGDMKQYRLLGEETAANKGHNLDTFSICLAGNFTVGVEKPTLEQKMKLKSVLKCLLAGNPVSAGIEVKPWSSWSFERDRIYPHRSLDPKTSCYGNSLTDAWARELVTTLDEEIEKNRLWTKILELTRKVLELTRKQKLGNARQHCSEMNLRG